MAKLALPNLHPKPHKKKEPKGSPTKLFSYSLNCQNVLINPFFDSFGSATLNPFKVINFEKFALCSLFYQRLRHSFAHFWYLHQLLKSCLIDIQRELNNNLGAFGLLCLWLANNNCSLKLFANLTSAPESAKVFSTVLLSIPQR